MFSNDDIKKQARIRYTCCEDVLAATELVVVSTFWSVKTGLPPDSYKTDIYGGTVVGSVSCHLFSLPLLFGVHVYVATLTLSPSLFRSSTPFLSLILSLSRSCSPLQSLSRVCFLSFPSLFLYPLKFQSSVRLLGLPYHLCCHRGFHLAGLWLSLGVHPCPSVSPSLYFYQVLVS